MEPSVQIFVPSRLYSRFGWTALAGSSISVLCGFRAPLAFLVGFLCAITAAGAFWLAARPQIRIASGQFNIGERSVAWREVREINTTQFMSPLLLRVKLTNMRWIRLIYPGEPEQIQRLISELRQHSFLASFDGVAFRDYWTWVNLNERADEPAVSQQPIRMLSVNEEEEIERLYQKLKTVGRLDSRSNDSSNEG